MIPSPSLGCRDRAHLMVVPAVRIIIQNDDRRGSPEPRQHDRIHRAYEEILLQERIGVPGMAILGGNRLQEADRGHISSSEGVEEVVKRILVIGPAIV